MNDDKVTPHTSAYNYLVTIGVALGSFLYGYATNVISGALAFPSFQVKFLATQGDSRIGALLGVFLGGGVIGAIVQAPISDRWGRRPAMAVGALFHVVGAALEAGSVHIAMLLVARTIAGIGSAMTFSVAPVLMGEVAPPHTRGFLLSLHVAFLDSGYLFSAIASLGLSYYTAAIQWRLNFIINAGLGLVLLLALVFIPESPRYLAMKGDYERAYSVLLRLHRHKADPEDRIARAEMAQIKEQLTADQDKPRGYMHILRTPTLRHRAWCTILIWFTCQATGVLVIANLTPLLFAGLGYGSTVQFGLSVAWLCTCIIGALLGGYLVDRCGRVLFMVVGAATCALALIIEAAMQAEFLSTQNKSGLAAGVAAYFFFGFFYNIFFDAGSFVYTAEIWPSHVRSEGMTIGMTTFYLFAIAYNAPASVAFATIGWRYYLVFIILTVLAAVGLWFLLPETTGLTLEEIGVRFGETPPVRFEDAVQQEGRKAPTAEMKEVVEV